MGLFRKNRAQCKLDLLEQGLAQREQAKEPLEHAEMVSGPCEVRFRLNFPFHRITSVQSPSLPDVYRGGPDGELVLRHLREICIRELVG